MDVQAMLAIGAVVAALGTAVVALRKAKPESASILVTAAVTLTESQTATLRDRDERLTRQSDLLDSLQTQMSEMTRRTGALEDTIGELQESISRVEQERDRALARAEAAEEEAASLRHRVEQLEQEVAELRGRKQRAREVDVVEDAADEAASEKRQQT